MPVDLQDTNFILALANILAKFEKAGKRELLEKKLRRQFQGMSSKDIPGLEKVYDELKIDMEFM